MPRARLVCRLADRRRPRVACIPIMCRSFAQSPGFCNQSRGPLDSAGPARLVTVATNNLCARPPSSSSRPAASQSAGADRWDGYGPRNDQPRIFCHAGPRCDAAPWRDRPSGRTAPLIRPVIDTQAGRPRRSRWPRAARAQARRNGRCLRRRPSTRSSDCCSSSAPPIRHGAQGDERETPPSSKRILIRARRSHHVDHARSPRCRHDQAATAQQAVHGRASTLRASATGARSGSTANASRTSPPTRRSETPCACWRGSTTLCTTRPQGRPHDRDRHRQRRLHAQVLQGAAQSPRSWSASRDAIAEWAQRHLRLDGPHARLQGLVPGDARRQRRLLRAVRRERPPLVQELPGEVAFVNHAIVNPPVDRNKPLDEVRTSTCTSRRRPTAA